MENIGVHKRSHQGDHVNRVADNLSPPLPENQIKLAVSTTLHCLLGCGLGEVIGMIFATHIGLGNVSSIILAVSLGFVFGFMLGMIPLLKSGRSLREAFKIVLAAEGMSIVAMETAEVLVAVYTPGVMEAGLNDGIFWAGMLLALVAGFLAAFPVNFFLIKKGSLHHH